MALSTGELICVDFNRYLKELEKQGRCMFLPFEIQELTLRNIGRFNEKNIDFDTFNIVFGNIGSGRTTLLKSIGCISDSQKLLKSGQRDGEIGLTMTDGRRLHLDICEAGEVKCIVLDDVGERLDQERYGEFLRYLRALDVQVILLRGNMNDELDGLINRTFPDCTFIQLN